MDITPLHDRVVIKPLEEEQTTDSGIVIPDTAKKEKPQKGEVVAVGPGRINDAGKPTPLSVNKGDTVLFRKFGPDEVEVEGETYLVVKESDILGILN